MADKISEARRSYNMRRIRSKDTSPEKAVRRLVYHLGYRYRLHDKSLPGKPDLVFKGRKKAIFVHGCFWHQHPSGNCADSRPPSSRTEYWLPKLQRNIERDQSNLQELDRLGWDTLVIWACQVESDPDNVAASARSFLDK